MQVAQEILRQLGGHRFLLMTGAKNLTASENRLSMRLPRNRSGASHLSITLEATDLYTMRFFKTRKYELTVAHEEQNVYNDGLTEVFEHITGLKTSL